jgi:hypothetical protein
MFSAEGTFAVTITDAHFQPGKFNDAAMDAVLVVDDGQGHVDEWRGEFSPEVPFSDGPAAGKTRAQMTMETLARLGDVSDPSQIGGLVGVQTTVTIKATEKNDRVYYNVRYIGGRAQQRIEGEELQQRLAAMFGSSAAAPQTAPQAAPPQTTAAPPPPWAGTPPAFPAG